MMALRLMALLLALVGLAGASGCGFHLRGQVDIPAELNPMHISGGGQLRERIKERLVGSQVRLTTDPKAAKLLIGLGSGSRTSRVVAVDRSGKALLYESTYRVTFQARLADGTEVVPREKVIVVRELDDNPNRSVLGQELESDIVYQDMVEDAADRILLRLRARLATL